MHFRIFFLGLFVSLKIKELVSIVSSIVSCKIVLIVQKKLCKSRSAVSDLVVWSVGWTTYRTRAIISRGLYIFYPIFKDHFFVFKEVFSENSVLMFGLYSRTACNQERLMMARVRYVIFEILNSSIPKLQVNNYEIVVKFFHISRNLTWYSAIVHKFTRIYPVCSTYELTKQFM